MKETIATLTSKEDSLARQYILLKQERDNLENVSLTVSNLNTRLAEVKTEDGIQSGRIHAYLGNVLLGSFEWRLPESLNADREQGGEASFSMESIDYVRVTPAERQLLQSLGDRVKLRVNLSSRTDTLEVTPAKEGLLQEIGERDRAVWNWSLRNRGSQDGRLLLEARLVNKNGDEIPLIQTEPLIASSNLVRQVRSYLMPIPLILGAVLGSLLMGIVGLFRRAHRAVPGKPDATREAQYGGRKQL